MTSQCFPIISDHLTNLQHIFDRCRNYGTSLNSKKSIFVVIEGKILEYFICKDGIFIDSKIIEVITPISYPNNKKVMQSFLGKIIFFHRFVSGFAENIKPLQIMIKKDVIFKWNNENKESFFME